MSVCEKLICYFAAEEVTTRFGLMDDGKMRFMAAFALVGETCMVAVDPETCALFIAFSCWSAIELPSMCLVAHRTSITQLMTGVNNATLYISAVVLLASENHERARLWDAKVSGRKQSMQLSLAGRGK